MSNRENSPVAAPPSPIQRRSSYAPGQRLSEMFGRSPTTATSGTAAYPNSIAAAAASAHSQQGRRVSISTLGLSGSPTQTSPFGNGRSRKESTSSSTDESAIDDNDAAPPPSAGSFQRRLSFGARAMRDVRGGGTGIFHGRSTSSSHPATAAAAAPGARSAPRSSSGEGFNWSDQMRSRAERSTSMSTSPTATGSVNPFRGPTKSTSVSAAEPPKELPKVPRAPDHFQERILKGDFYMD